MRTRNARGAVTVSSALAVLLTLSSVVWAEIDVLPGPARLNPQTLYLKQGTVNAERDTAPALAGMSFTGQSRRVIIQLDGPMNADRRARLEESGVILADYIPANAFIARFDEVDPEAFGQLDFVRWLAPFRDEWKLDPQLGRRSFKSERRIELAEQGWAQVVAVLFDGADLAAALPELEAADAEIVAQTRVGRQWMVDLVIPLANVDRLAAVESVQFIEDAPEGSPRNDTNEWILQSDVEGQTPIWDVGLHGEGQIGGLIDGTIKVSHCSFADTEPIGPTHRKVVAMRNAGADDGHGTHVAGTFVGDRETYGEPDQYDGMALAAKISFSNVTPIYGAPSTLHARLLDAHNDGARVHNNSWGDDSTTAYTTWCRQIDQFSYDYEDNLVVFAVTNTSTLKSPENAKNVLAVAATWDAPDENDHYSGGSGPTDDGRRKPEIYAPGYFTNSASLSGCGFVGNSGTSMAAPAISGAGLLVRQYFTDGYYPTGLPENAPLTPSGALIKATLINATVDMTDVPGYPGDQEGWGRLVLDNSLYFPGELDKLYVEDVQNIDGLSTGEEALHYFTAMDDSRPVRITLAFTEPPASVSASDPVINNLDLELVTPEGDLYRGNWFVDGESAPDGSADPLNNLERIILNTVSLGGYTVRIKGTTVNEGTQGYALVVNGGLVVDCNDNGSADDADINQGTSADCNANAIPDECDVSYGLSLDCQPNVVPDECDLAFGASADVNGDGVPDECCLPLAVPLPEPNGAIKNRYVSFSPGDGGVATAFRLTLTASADFGDSVGEQKWVGPPDPDSGIARLQCTAEFRDWSLDPAVIHVGDVDIVPAAQYALQRIASGCALDNEASYSPPRALATVPLWGDCVGENTGEYWTPPNDVVNITDVMAAVQLFLVRPTAPPLVWMDIDDDPPNTVLNFTDIFQIVLAYKGDPYPFSGPVACP